MERMAERRGKRPNTKRSKEETIEKKFR